MKLVCSFFFILCLLGSSFRSQIVYAKVSTIDDLSPCEILSEKRILPTSMCRRGERKISKGAYFGFLMKYKEFLLNHADSSLFGNDLQEKAYEENILQGVNNTGERTSYFQPINKSIAATLLVRVFPDLKRVPLVDTAIDLNENDWFFLQSNQGIASGVFLERDEQFFFLGLILLIMTLLKQL